MRFVAPSALVESGSDQHRTCRIRLRYVFRLSQPPDALFLPRPFRLCFTPVAPLGFSLQRFAPLASPTPSLDGPAPPGVIGRGPPKRARNPALQVAPSGQFRFRVTLRAGNRSRRARPAPGRRRVGHAWTHIPAHLVRPVGPERTCALSFLTGRSADRKRSGEVCVPSPSTSALHQRAPSCFCPIRSHEGFESRSARHRCPAVLHHHSPEGGWTLSRKRRSLVRKSR
jgi:hypothetical protein